jgi:alkaline phosphatase D
VDNIEKNLFRLLSIFLLIITVIIVTFINYPRIYGEENSNPSLTITEGIASGDVTHDSAIIWSRINEPSIMHVEFANNVLFLNSKSETKFVDQNTDFTGNIKLNNLTAATKYFYRVYFSTLDNNITSSSIVGTFKTAPNLVKSSDSISFIVGADIGGQTYCRERNTGYSIFEEMTKLKPDFYIQNGDMIYADNDCPKQRLDGHQNIAGNFFGISDPKVNWNNKTHVHDIYLKHWLYNRADPHLQNFLKNTSMYSQWDDHEVLDDFGADWSYWNSENQNRTGYQNLVQEGRKLFFNFSPMDRNNITDPNRIYRTFYWGDDLDLLILDARSDRSRNDVTDTIDNNKTMLGSAQLSWLKDNLLRSNATWKVVSSDIPMSIPTGANSSKFGHDGWANGISLDFSSKTGFERELEEIMKFIDDNNIKNVVFVTTDVHFPIILKYNADMNSDGDSVNVYEIISGPLSAFTFGSLSSPLLMPDPTFQPTILYVEGGIFNFAYLQIAKGTDGKSHMLVDIIGAEGIARLNSHLDLIAQ